jgi:hypothetical protein
MDALRSAYFLDIHLRVPQLLCFKDHNHPAQQCCLCFFAALLLVLRLLLPRAVFDVLYMLIGHAHDSEETALKLDPPDDFFRIRLVRQLWPACFWRAVRGRHMNTCKPLLAFACCLGLVCQR